MRRKAPLTMMELMVMTVVFALCAALCLQAFVKSDALSRRSEARDQAVVLCQSVAEIIQHYGGVLPAAAEGKSDTVMAMGSVNAVDGKMAYWYDEDWNAIRHILASTAEIAVNDPPEGAVYRLSAEEQDSGMPGLGSAVVQVTDLREDEVLFRIEVSWQKGVTPNG